MTRSLPRKVADLALRKALDGYGSVFARRGLYSWHLVAHKFVLRGLGINNEGFRAGGEKRFLDQLRRQGLLQLVVDVGANVGDYALMVRELAPGARIVAIEPNPRTFRRLEAATRDSGIESIHCALGQAACQAVLYDYDREGTGHASLHREVITDLHGLSAVEMAVTVETLDALALRLGIDHIDLLKIDTEGNELACLTGARRLLEQDAIDVVQFEFNSMNIVSGSSFKSFMDLLHGYRFFRLFRDGLARIEKYRALECEIYGYQNVVAVRRGSRFEQ